MLLMALLTGLMRFGITPEVHSVMPGYTIFRMSESEAFNLTEKEDLNQFSPAMISRYDPRPRFFPWWFVVNQWAGFSPQLGRLPTGYIVTWINTLLSPVYRTHDNLAQAFNLELSRPVWTPGIYCSSKMVRAHLRTCISYEYEVMNIVYQVATKVMFTTLIMDEEQRIEILNQGCPWFPDQQYANNHVWYHFGMACDRKQHHLSIAMATWRDDDGLGGIELAHFFNNEFYIAFIEEPLKDTQTWPDICILQNERLFILWQNTDGYGIWGILVENTGDRIDGQGVIHVTEGMEPGFFWRPMCLATYGGQFMVVWKEDTLGVVPNKFPYPTIWMREFEMDAIPKVDNPLPRRVTVSPYDAVGYIPMATATLDGDLWVSWVTGISFRGGRYDRFGNIMDYWMVTMEAQYGYPNASRLGQITYGEMDQGFAVTAIGSTSRRVLCFKHDPMDMPLDRESSYKTQLEFLMYKDLISYWDRWFLMNHTKYWVDEDRPAGVTPSTVSSNRSSW